MIKKYFILALGCQMNKSDGEKIETILAGLGYTKADSESTADLIVAVACSVKQSAIDRIYGKAHNWQEKRQQGKLFTILTGCVLKPDQKKMAKIFDLVLAVKDIDQIPQKLSFLKKSKIINIQDYFNIKPRHNSKFQAYVPIMTGCNNFCTFCVVPYTRGREVCKPAEDIIKECKDLIKSGYKEIIFLGQNVNSYKSGSYDFAKLLSAVDKIKGDYWLRFLSSNPQDFSLDLIKFMSSGVHITPYLHFAIQSGDDAILKKMNRRHSVAHYLKIIKMAKEAMPHLMVSTDIIVGFPTETRKQFNNSIKVARQVGYDMIYISQYSNRVGTAAAKILKDNVSKAEKVRREKELNEVLIKTALENNRRYINRSVKVLVEGQKKGKYFGKTDTFKTVIFTGSGNIIGQFVKVKIDKVGSWCLYGGMENTKKQKLIVILGPTATGKTKLAVKLAYKYQGEIVSADSRQVYKGMDIGTGKDLRDYTVKTKAQKIKYHLIDVISPRSDFNVSKYQKLAYGAIEDILKRNKVPFLVGGTGLYIDAVAKGYEFSPKHQNTKTQKEIRKKLNKLSLKELLTKLKKVDLETYKTIDKKNRRRVQRALEIFYETGRLKSVQIGQQNPPYDVLLIGLRFPLAKIYQKIDQRLKSRLAEGMISEVKRLRQGGVSWKKLDDFGLEYRYVSRYLRGQINHNEMVEQLKKAIHHLAKRQLTWFKRNKDIIWINGFKEASGEIKKFLNK
ncbi:MAG: tRNA (N6-isopentenyl adenosine(37)-C2)-methylthiotransferase MiaB [Candidatus Buchananbacteria bacterium]|nr:tRNA (N6-isopentenyl adenosine(37)-C2)-methylthiotransferase MiaB [Candidatus Buchananbacteria bacterium]